MKWCALILLVVCGCKNPVQVTSSGPPGVDFNDDDKVGFSDFERGTPPPPPVDFERV